jgi:hypothetical protein
MVPGLAIAMVPGLAIVMEKDNKFELYFLIICRYLNLVENQRMIS